MRKGLKIFYITFGTIYLITIIMGVVEYVPPHNYSPIETFESNLPPSAVHLLGTNYYQKDILTRFIYGSRTSFYSGIIVVIPFFIIGIILGVGSSFSYKSWTRYVEKINEVLNSFPKLLAIFLFIGLYGVKPYAVLFFFGIISAPKLAEFIKAKIMSLRKEEFIDASIALGIPWYVILFKHVLWYNCRTGILSQLLYIYSMAIIIEASLSYIGLGFSGDTVSWGDILDEAIKTSFSKDLFSLPWTNEFPMEAFTAAIAITVLSFSLFYLSELFQQLEQKQKGIYA